MNNTTVKSFWIGFVFTAALTALVYLIWKQKRVVAPRPLVVSRSSLSKPKKVARQPAVSQERTTISDALEEITGIGPVFANRLNEAGIFTYAQLASSSPEELTQITGATRWDPADWISEASQLADNQ